MSGTKTTETAVPSGAAVNEIAGLVKALHAPQLLVLPDGNQVLALPGGLRLEALKPLMEPYLNAPERRTGTARFTELASFIAHVKRFADADSMVFATDDEARPSFTAVLDYHRAGAEGAPRFGRHRGFYAPALSEAWQAWAEAEKESPLGVPQFQELLQDRLGDVVEPPQDGRSEADAKLLDLVQQFGGGGFAGQSRLLELAKGLRLRETQDVAGFANVQSGEVEIQFKTQHTGADGAPLKVPQAFIVGVPVFERGPAYRMVIRLLYRNEGGKLRWILKRHRPDVIFDDAFNEAAATIGAETALPLLRGAPEA